MVRTRYQRSETVVNTGWLVTFTDLAILVLAFFVLLFSMSTIREDHWNALVSTLAQSLDPSNDRARQRVTAELTIDSKIETEAIDLEYLASVLEEKMRQDAALGRSVLRRLDDRLVISLPSDVFFAAGGAELDSAGREALFVLSGTLDTIANRVDVQGRSDTRPLDDSVFASGWELSLARAVAVAQQLRKAGYGREVVTQGLGQPRAAAAPPPRSEQPPVSRVDIVIRPTVVTR